MLLFYSFLKPAKILILALIFDFLIFDCLHKIEIPKSESGLSKMSLQNAIFAR